jgi:hypothetical protein
MEGNEDEVDHFLPMRPIVRVRVAHVRHRVEIKCAMAGEEIVAMLGWQEIDLLSIEMRVSRSNWVDEFLLCLAMDRIIGLGLGVFWFGSF